jgi:hypothetical protein
MEKVKITLNIGSEFVYYDHHLTMHILFCSFRN